MSTTRPSIPPFLLAASFLLPLALAAVAPARAAQDHQAFRDQFQKAMAINSTAEMERLVKSMNREAVEWIMVTAEAISDRTSDELETRMGALRKAWKGAMETNFCDEMYEYFALLDPRLKTERTALRKRYEKERSKYIANLEKKDGPAFALAGGEFRGLGETFEQVGDKYYASECFVFVGSCYDETNRGKDADLYAAAAGYKRVVELREKIGLKDRTWTECSTRYSHLKALGYDREKPSDEELEAERMPKGTEPAVEAVLAFELVAELDAVARPCYYADELYPMWTSLPLRTKGSSVKLNTLGDLSPTVLRVASNDVEIDSDGDGAGDVKIPLTGNLMPIRFELGQGDERRPWGMLAIVGVQQDFYQGIQINLAPDDNQMTIYLAPAASMRGEIGGVPIQVFDDNMDGIYGSDPLSWQHIGLSQGLSQPELDCIVIDGAKRARPWSEYQQIGQKWYRLEIVKGGKEIQGEVVAVETGTLELEFKGGKPSWLIVQGTDVLDHCYFDLSGGDAQVPAGRYSLFYGELRKGKKRQEVKTLILPGEATPSWEVGQGMTTTIELGAPFGFDFKFEEDDETIRVDGESVVVVGSAGERYERPWGCVARPEVAYRSIGSRRASKPEKMKAVLDQDQVFEIGWRSAWSPLDLVLTKKGGAERSEVQLSDKKHKLFGKVSSDWKQ